MRTMVEPTYRGIIKLASPVVISMMSMTLMGAVDTFIVGFLGTSQLAAVGFMMMLCFNLLAFAQGFMGAVTTLVSQNFGARNFSTCRAVVWQGMLFSVFYGIFCFLISFLIKDILNLMRFSEEIQKFGTLYGSVYMMGGIFIVFNYAMISFFQGIGNTKIPMMVAIFSNLINAGLAWVLVLGWNGFGGYGVAGAAWATIFASACSSLIYFIFFVRTPLGREIHRKMRLNFSVLRKIFSLGIPMGIQMFLGMSAFMIFCLFIGWMGETTLAANRIVMQLDQLAFMPIIGISQAAQVVVGQYIGARKFSLAKQMANRAILLGTLFEIVAGIFYFVYAESLARFFSHDPEVVFLSSRVMHFSLAWMSFDALFMVSLGALRGAGDVRWPMAVNLILGYGMRLPLAYFAAFSWGLGLSGMWIVLTGNLILLGIILYARFSSGHWMKRYETSGMVPETATPVAMA